jgi:hypothetical protein
LKIHEGEYTTGTRPDLVRGTRAAAWHIENRFQVVDEAIPRRGVVCTGWRVRFPSIQTLDSTLKCKDTRLDSRSQCDGKYRCRRFCTVPVLRRSWTLVWKGYEQLVFTILVFSACYGEKTSSNPENSVKFCPKAALLRQGISACVKAEMPKLAENSLANLPLRRVSLRNTSL